MKLRLGTVLVTAGIDCAMAEDMRFHKEVISCISRHAGGDWGDLCDEDKCINNHAVNNNERILSAYETTRGRIWIISEWDRKHTTVLFPEEY